MSQSFLSAAPSVIESDVLNTVLNQLHFPVQLITIRRFRFHSIKCVNMTSTTSQQVKSTNKNINKNRKYHAKLSLLFVFLFK